MVYLRWVGHWTCGILDDCWGIFCSLVEMQVSDLNWKNHSEDLKWNYDSTSLQCFSIYTCSAFWNFLTLNTLQLSSKGEIWNVLFQFILCPMFSTSVIAGSNIIYDWYFKGTQLNNVYVIYSRQITEGHYGWTVCLHDGNDTYEANGYDYVLDLMSEMEIPPAFPWTQAPFLVTCDMSNDTSMSRRVAYEDS